MAKQKLVIIGNGMSGGKLIEELVLRESGQFDITIIGDEPYENYNRIKLAKKIEQDDVPDFFLTSSEWCRENGINMILGNRIESVDKEKKEIKAADGAVFPYDKLVFAVGSLPFIPPIKNVDLPGVITLRTLQDALDTREYLKDKSNVTIVGGGLLGLELALSLQDIGKTVTVSHMMSSLMELQLTQEPGDFLKRKLEKRNMKFIMETYITELEGDETGVKKAIFENGTTLMTEAVFISTGIRPNVALAKETGLKCARGIVVNDIMQTSDPDIYAIGECIEYNGQTWGLVAPVYEQARVLAGVLNGEDTGYMVSKSPTTFLKSDIPVITMGSVSEDPEAEIALYIDHNSLIYKRLVIKDNKLVSANIIGDDLNIDAISLHYSAGIPLPDNRADLLFPGASSESVLSAEDWDDSLLICDCNGITAGKIREAIRDGNDTLRKAVASSRAGTGCGNCKSKVQALLIDEVGELKEDPEDKYFVPGVPLDRPALTSHILNGNLKSVSAVLASIKDTRDDGKTRMGLDFLLNYVWKGKYSIEPDSRFANDRYSANIQKDGTFSVIPRMHGGKSSSEQLKAIAEVAEEYGATIKITGADRIGLYSIRKEDLEDVWKKLGTTPGHAWSKTFRAAKSCVGSEFCRWGNGPSMTFGARIDDRYRGIAGPAKFKVGVSGCPRNCAEATIKDLGFVAVDNGWDVYIGGNAGSNVIPAIKIARVETEDEALKIGDLYYEFYRKNANYGERSAYFVQRFGLETVREAILSGRKEDLQQLARDFQETVDNYQDPWAGGAVWDQDGGRIETSANQGEEIPVCKSDDIPAGTSKVFTVDEEEIVLFHSRNGEWAASESRCPHEQGPIEDCMFGGGKLVCPIHNMVYDTVTGKCSNDEVDDLRVFPVSLRNGQVFIKIQDVSPSGV